MLHQGLQDSQVKVVSMLSMAEIGESMHLLLGGKIVFLLFLQKQDQMRVKRVSEVN